jgi:hypothetical protein
LGTKNAVHSSMRTIDASGPDEDYVIFQELRVEN